MKTKHSLFTMSALLAATGAANAALITLGTSATQAPTAVPTITVAPGASVSLDLYAQAEGTGYFQNASIGLYSSSAASFAGGPVNAANQLPAATVFSGTATNTYASNIANIFGSSRKTPNTTAITGATVVLDDIGGTNLSQPSSAITSAGAQLISTITGTVTTTPGTYYLYLGRNSSTGINESPASVKVGGIGAVGTGATATNTSTFGFGDSVSNPPVFTGGSGANGTTTNTLPRVADAIIIVQAAGASLSLTPTVTAPTTVSGTGDSYQPTLLAANEQFALGGTPDAAGHTYAAFDFSGGTDYSNFFAAGLPAGAVQLTAATSPTAASLISVFNQLGGSYDVIIDLGAGKPQGTLGVANLPNGVTLNAVAVVPEPTTLSLAGIGAVLAMGRRRRQTA